MFIYTGQLIGSRVRETCRDALTKYESKDCVSVLIIQADDETAPFRERNYAIWSLGQLGDKRALSTLKEMYTGNIPEREPYDDGISQYELKKAIKLIEGGTNITSFVWR